MSYALAGNVLTISDVSFDDAPTLVSLQSPSFSLFTIYFDAIGLGASSLSISSVTLADAYGNEGAFIARGSSIDVLPVSAVPEPGSLPLLCLGGVLMMILRRQVAGRQPR